MAAIRALLPDEQALYTNRNSAYEVLARHKGCRSNSAQNDSYGVRGFGLDDIFHFAVRGTAGDFNESYPRGSGVCVNSYLFWNHRVSVSRTGPTDGAPDALPRRTSRVVSMVVIAQPPVPSRPQ